MLKYIVKKPRIITKTTPALLMLHGYGSNELDLFSLADQLPDNLYIFSVRAPYSLSFGGYAWYDITIDQNGLKKSDNQQALQSVFLLSDFIDELKEKYELQKGSFNIMGFSQGSILSYALALHFPEKIKNILALSGYINEDIVPIKFSNYKHLNFFVAHGLYDEVIPIQLARKIPPYLSDLLIKHVYNEYPMGHEISYQCLEDMIHWIVNKII